MSETKDNLSWQAFRYVANELDAAETSEFELLLATDQAAREAVANAVGETARIRQALDREAVATATSQRSSWNRKTARVTTVAIGSCLALFLALCLVRSSVPVPGRVADLAIANELTLSRAQLAYAWAEARNGSIELQAKVDAELSNTLDSVLTGPIDSESEQSLVAPSWMLAALVKMDGGIDTEDEVQE